MSTILQKCVKCGCFKALTDFTSTRGDASRGRTSRPKKTCESCLARRRLLYEPTTFTSIDYPVMTIEGFFSRVRNCPIGVQLNVKGTIQDVADTSSLDNLVVRISDIDGFIWNKEQASDFERVDGGMTQKYRCSQREKPVRLLETPRERMRRPLDLFHCHGYIHIMRRLPHLLVQYVHKTHQAPPTHAIRDSTIRDFIIYASNSHTSPEIMQSLVTGALPNSNIMGLTTQAVHNLWLATTINQYRRHPNAHQSALLLLPELQNMSVLFSHPSPNNKPRIGLSTIFMGRLVAEDVVECYVDDTKGLEHSGLKVYCMMGLVQSKAVPVSYFFCGAGDQPGDTTRWLEEWFQTLRNDPLNPLQPMILFSDKDKAQMAAAESVWGSDVIRLCLWHVRDALTRKLNRQANAQEGRLQRLSETDLLLLDLTSQGVDVDLDWVRSGQTASLNRRARDQVLQQVMQHGARHPALENQDFSQIHDECLAEIYQLMRELDKPAMFRYLYINWYRPDMFSKWSMAGGPQLEGFIPIGRTTMVLESHWNDLKNRWFSRTYRPRLDYILHKLNQDILPAIAHRLENSSEILGNDSPSWWREFRTKWIEAQQFVVDTDRYNTNLMDWKCGCSTFRSSNVLLCSHMVTLALQQCPGLVNLHWSQIKRNQFPPYIWIDRIHRTHHSDLSNTVSIQQAPSPESVGNVLALDTTMIVYFQNSVRDNEDPENDDVTDETLPTLGDIVNR